MRRTALVFSVVLAAVAVPQPAHAWGFEVHKFIMRQAIPLLPPEIRPYFEKYQVTIVEHAVDPDLWRTAGWEIEPPRHFVDLDAYGPYPFKDIPRDYDEAVKRYGRDFVEKNGTLPWRTQEIYGKLVEAFTQKAAYSRENVKFFSSVIAHYTADAHVPFHGAVNYDGQLTGQWGIHARFESELFDRYVPRLKLASAPVVPIRNVRDFIFDTLIGGFPYVQQVLDADKAAVAGRDVYDDGYFTLLFGKAQPILEKQLSASITDVASVITAAWVEAGRPVLPLDAPATPRKVRRQ